LARRGSASTPSPRTRSRARNQSSGIIVRWNTEDAVEEERFDLHRYGSGLRGLAHLGIFVEAAEDLTRARVVARHQRGGRSDADAEAHWRRSDAVNTKLVNENRHGVDILLLSDAFGRLRLR
jgi:hypothetical protein